MPVYEYSALDIKGRSVSGIIDAESALTARQKLRSSKIFPIAIRETLESPVKKGPGRLSGLRPGPRTRTADISMMTRQLAILIGAGFPLVSALDTLIPQTKSQAFKKLLARLKDSIVEGNSFAVALNQYSSTFSSLYINMVQAGETSGTLEIVLERLADIIEKQQELKHRIRSALTYPIFMSIIGAGVLFLLLAFIVPSITSIFHDMNQMLPAPTLVLIHISEWFKSYWWAAFAGLAGLTILFRKTRKTDRGNYAVDKFLLKMPVLGILIRKLTVARFSRTLGSLLENGVSMLTALEIVKNIAGNRLFCDFIQTVSTEVEKGKALGAALSESNLFPDLSIQMVQVGEQSGELESMLKKIADIYEKEAESSIMSMTSMLEPVMILIMGILVGFIVLSICLPIFEMNQLVR